MTPRAALHFFGGAGLLGLSPVVVSIATFISVPLILAAIGPEGWLSIAVGQAIGELARVLVIWGWNSIGLARSAPMSPEDRMAFYFRSLLPRAMVLVPTVPLVILASVWIPLTNPLAAALTGITGAVYGLTAGWMLVSSRQPLALLTMDAIPRSFAILLGALIVSLTAQAAYFGAITIVGSLVAVVVPLVVCALRARRSGYAISLGTVAEAILLLREGLPAVGAGLVAVGRMSFAVLFSPVISASGAAAVALGDKFVRWANTGMTPLMQSLQVRIPRGDRPLADRARRGIAHAWLLALPIGLLVAIAVPPVSGLISHDEIRLDWMSSIPIGMSITFFFVASITGNSVLVLLGRMRTLLLGSVIALAALVVSFWPLYTAFGAPGAFWAMVLSEGTVAVYQFVVVRRALRHLDAESAGKREEYPHE